METAELTGDRLRIWAHSGTEGAECRQCGQFSSRVHSTYRRRLADAPVGGHLVVLWPGMRRFFCGNADCKAVTFAGQFDGLTSPRARRTPPLARMLTAIALAMAWRAGTRLAAELDLPASRTGMLRLVMALPDPETGTVTILGIDDFAFRRGRNYGTILINVETGRPVDLLRDREADTVANWLKEHPGIKVICRDRAGAYADGARQGAPDADQVADRWHIYHNLCEHVDKAAARHRTCLEEPAPEEPEEPAAPDAPEVPDLQQAAIEAAARRAEESTLAVRTRQRYDLGQSLKAQGKGIKPIMRETGLAKDTVRRFYYAESIDELLAKVKDGRPSILDEHKAYLHQRCGVMTASGRPIPASRDQPAFCYVLADLTPTMVSRCEYAGLRPTHDGMGYFGFNEPHKAYIEVMSFDRLVNSATERNRAFFDKLGLPST